MESILDRSRATEAFRTDLRRYEAGHDADRVRVVGYAPRVKVERVLTQLLHAEPDLAIERVAVSGRSGCSDFVGQLVVETATERRTIDFTWCCRWRAEVEGWTDYFGFPDQIRAAREFGWDCFQRWETSEVTPIVPLALEATASQELALA